MNQSAGEAFGEGVQPPTFDISFKLSHDPGSVNPRIKINDSLTHTHETVMMIWIRFCDDDDDHISLSIRMHPESTQC